MICGIICTKASRRESMHSQKWNFLSLLGIVLSEVRWSKATGLILVLSACCSKLPTGFSLWPGPSSLLWIPKRVAKWTISLILFWSHNMDCKINCIAETYYPSSAEIFPDSCQARQCNSWGLSTSSAFTNEDVSDQALNLLQWDSEKMETPDQCFCLLSCQGKVFPQAEQSIPSSVPRCSLPVAAAAHWVAAFAKTYCKPNSGEARVPSLVTQRNLNTQTENKSKMKKKLLVT